MFKASSLLLMILVLNVQLYSSAPIHGEFVQPSVVAEEPQEVAGEEGHYPEESVQKKLIPNVEGKSAPSPAGNLTSEEQTAKQDIPAIARDPEPVFVGDQVTADIDNVVSQDSAFAEASPGETTVTVELAVDGESPEHHDPKDQATAEALEDEALEKNAKVEEAIAVESTAEEASPEEPLLVIPDENAEVPPADSQEPLPGAEEDKSVVLVPAEVETEEASEVEPTTEELVPEQSGPEEPDVILDPEEPAQHEPDPEKQQEIVPIISSKAKQEGHIEEHAEVEAAVLVVVEENAVEENAVEENAVESAEMPLPVVLGENTEEKPATDTEPLHSTPEEEKSIVHVPAELDSKEETVAQDGTTRVSPTKVSPRRTCCPCLVEQTNEEPAPDDPILVFPLEDTEEDGLKDNTEEGEEAAVLVVVEENAEEPLPSTTEKEESVVLFSVELETEEGDKVEPAAEETVPQESATEVQVVMAPVEPAEGEPDPEEQEEIVPIIFSETEKEEAPVEPAKEVEAAVPMVLEENVEEDPATNKDLPPEEEESVVLFPVEHKTEDEGQEGPAAEEAIPQESAPEDPVVIAPVVGEPDLEEQVAEKSIPIVSPEAPEEEASEEHTKVEAAVTVESAEMPLPIVPEENAEEEPATDKEPLHSTPEEEKSTVHVPAELDSEEDGQEETEPQDKTTRVSPTRTCSPCVVVPTNEEPAPDDPILVFSLEDSEEDGPEDNTTGVEAAVQSDLLPHEPALEEDTAPQETEPDDSDPVILIIPVTETPSESETIKKGLDPVEGVTVAATEILTEAPAVIDAEVEIVLAAVDGGDGIRNKTYIEDFEAAIILIKDEPVAQVSRGAVLGAAFLALMSFIVIGFVWTTVSKKLR